MRRYRHLLGLLTMAALALSLQVCGGGGSSNTGPGPTVPAPVPEPTAAPTPVMDPPLSASCTAIGPGVLHNETKCNDDDPHYLDQVTEAIHFLRNQRPEIFDGRRVLNGGVYYVELIKILDVHFGLCADFDGEELGVAETHEFNEQYDILSAKADYRTGTRTYLGACFPSVVPRPTRNLPPSHAGCPLPPSDLVACARDPAGGLYHVDIDAAIDQLYEERPELFDFNKWAPGQGHPLITNPAAYHEAMVQILRDKGYCAIFDGEEIQMKQGSNEFSEHYDVNYQDAYVRRGEGSFRGSCHPSAF